MSIKLIHLSIQLLKVLFDTLQEAADVWYMHITIAILSVIK